MRGAEFLCSCAAAALLCACAGSGEGLDESGRPLEEAEEPPLTADLASIQRHVFTPICTGCHAGAAAPLGLRLEEGVAFAMLVNVPSVQVPSLDRVEPGNPDASYLIRKLEGTAAVGARMPLNAPPLPAQTIAVIRQWIFDGALPSAAAVSELKEDAPKIQTVWPVAGTKLTTPLSEIVLSANTELNAALLSAGIVELHETEGVGGKRPLETSIIVRSLMPTVFAVTTPQGILLPGRYELRVSGTPPLALTDLLGQAIDGDANGEAGGDFVMHFVVEDTQ